MNLIALKDRKVIEPPFKNSLSDIVDWLKPITVSVKGDIIVGGLMVHNRLLVCSAIVDDEIVKVQYPDSHRVVEAILIDYDGDFFLSYYAIDEKDARTDWVGIPNYNGQMDDDTDLFSYIHEHERDHIVRFRALSVATSKAFNREKGDKLVIDDCSRIYTYPVVDVYGYLVGINIGMASGEVICQVLTLTGTKL